MRSFWLAIRIAAIFTALVILVLMSTFHLFGRVAGKDLARALGQARVSEGAPVAEGLEKLLLDHKITDAQVARFVREKAQKEQLNLALLRPDGEPVVSTWRRRPHPGGQRPSTEITFRGRTSRLSGPPSYEAEIPLQRNGQRVGSLVVGGRLHSPDFHRSFGAGLLRIGIVVLVAVVGLALYLTRPLRLTSSSMDRIAAGDLDHRVMVKGHGEVARMGRVFNTMADRIQQMIVGQKELLAGVSHELRSPLARMKVGLELLREAGTDPRRVEELESEVDAIDEMVEELLVASRLDLGAKPLSLRVVDLAELATNAWKRLERDVATRRVRLNLDVHPEAHVVKVDEALAHRILGNLFENALRYAGEGTVHLTSRPLGDRVEVRVSDDGEGVDDEALARLFEPFFRADLSRSRRTGATGLGLMIVRRAVEAHGGNVAVRRRASGGLEVIFDLPAVGMSSE